MVEENIVAVSSLMFFTKLAYNTKFHVPTLPNKTELLNINIDIYLKLCEPSS